MPKKKAVQTKTTASVVAPIAPAAEQRADDQDTAIEAAFIVGALPEEDRREATDAPETPDVPVVVSVVAEPNAAPRCIPCDTHGLPLSS